MNGKNIIKEGFFEKLLRNLLPSSAKKSITNAYIKKKKSDIQKAEQELKKSYQRSEKLYQDARKHFKSKGIDLPASGDKKAEKEFWDKIFKEIK
jgi:DNA-binding ferritin-like protein